jgi:hypothetical protein
LLGSDEMNKDKDLEKQYTLLIEGLSLEEKSWLYNKAKKEKLSQGSVALRILRQEKGLEELRK